MVSNLFASLNRKRPSEGLQTPNSTTQKHDSSEDANASTHEESVGSSRKRLSSSTNSKGKQPVGPKGMTFEEASSRSPPKPISVHSGNKPTLAGVAQRDFSFPFKASFTEEAIREATMSAYQSSSARMLHRSEGVPLGKPGDVIQSLIDQSAQLHFTACHVGAIVSHELTARNASFTREREATKNAADLKAQLSKVEMENAELQKNISSLEDHLSQARLDICNAESKAKVAEEKVGKLAEELALAKQVQLSLEAKWADYEVLENAIQEMPQFGFLVRDLASRGFDLAIENVKKIAPDLDLAPVLLAFEAEMEEEEEEEGAGLDETDRPTDGTGQE